MLRIVGIQRAEAPDREFVLLQNQGSMRACLRGLVLLSECAVNRGDFERGAFVFRDEEHIPPGLYVLLTTGSGMPHWTRTKDGQYLYHAYMGRKSPVWSRLEGPLHLLSPNHSYVERGELMMLR